MTNRMFALTAAVVLATGAGLFASEKKIQLKNMPAAVQKAVEEHTKGSTIVGYVEEHEDGKVFYEAETKVSGRTRDLLFDANGVLVEVEEEVAADTLPAAVKTALSTRGKVLKVEAVTKGSIVTYEAEVEKNGKKSEVVMDARGNAIERR